MTGARRHYLPVDATGASSLNSREIQVLRLMCDGLFSKEIGRRLGLSYQSIQVYRVYLRRKTGCRSACQLGAWAVRNGLVPNVTATLQRGAA